MANFKTNVMRILETNKIDYNLYTYESDGDFDGCSVAGKIGKDVKNVFKTLVTVAPSKKNYVFVISVADELDLKACAASVGEKSVEMIAVKDINKTTGYIRGGCSPIGMKKQYVTVIDEACLTCEKMVFSAGKIGYQVEIAPSQLIDLIGAKVAKITR
ncbi:MAG: Cys-tRNA(Pro) deacylase [Clostridia bacterium]|nr:Cys-tRNA(Pro) deacylase [Clostridia bacterium]